MTEHDGTLYVLCFSGDGPDTGPHPITQQELRAAFRPRNGWNVSAIEPDRIQTRYHENDAPAWSRQSNGSSAGGLIGDPSRSLRTGLLLAGSRHSPGYPAGCGLP